MSKLNVKDFLGDSFNAADHKQDVAVMLLEHANDGNVDMKERRLARDRADAIRVELSLGKTRIGKWPTLEGDDVAQQASNGDNKPANGGAPKAKKTEAVKVPIEPGFVYVRNALQAWAFQNILIPHITKPDGHFTNNRPEGHNAFASVVKGVIVDPDRPGVTNGKHMPKRNYNLNDSTWLKPEVINPFIKDASKAMGRDVTKKELVTDLEQLKKILGMDVEEHEVKVKPATETGAPVEEEPETTQNA